MAEEEMMMSPEDASKLPSFHDTFSGSPQLVNTPLRFNDTGAVSSPSSDSSHGIQGKIKYLIILKKEDALFLKKDLKKETFL